MEFEVKRLDDHIDSKIQPQEESHQEAVIKQPKLEIPETIVPN
jgi:hypothetical protein